MYKLLILFIIILAIIIFLVKKFKHVKKNCICGSNCKCGPNCKCGSNCSCNINNNLKLNMQKVWLDHVYWTRLVGTDLLDGIDENSLKLSIVKLMNNQKDIANIFNIYFPSSGEIVEKLLKEHISIASDILINLKNNQSTDENMEKWKNNAMEISNALSTLSPQFNKNDILNMMNEHLDLTAKEFISYKNKDYETSILTFDQIENSIIMMSNSFTNYILNSKN